MENSRRRFADWKEHERELTPTQQALAELREYNEFNLWDKLLPWEKAALPPGADKHHAATEIARAYAAKHGITL